MSWDDVAKIDFDSKIILLPERECPECGSSLCIDLIQQEDGANIEAVCFEDKNHFSATLSELSFAKKFLIKKEEVK